MQLYNEVSYKCGKIITTSYSTSFSLAIRCLAKRFHAPIYGIYGFVRLADEIVDTFHEHDKARLLEDFERQTYDAIKQKVSANPALHAFQDVVNRYNVPVHLVEAFLKSMRFDLSLQTCDQQLYEEYIYGSAEVVGLMCLCVFCDGDQKEYAKLEAPARRLGAAFQKVNFLRDMQSDYRERGRVYFPNTTFEHFDDAARQKIERDIEQDFKAGYEGVKRLPSGARMGVYIAYIYYTKLFDKIRKTPTERILQNRIRIPNAKKLSLLLKTYIRYKINYL